MSKYIAGLGQCRTQVQKGLEAREGDVLLRLGHLILCRVQEGEQQVASVYQEVVLQCLHTSEHSWL